MDRDNKKVNINLKEGTEVVRVINEPVRERKIHEWNPVGYELESLKSVIDFVKRKGSKENTVIFYNTSSVNIVLDDSIQDRPLDKARYNFNLSDELKNWNSILGSRLNQKQLVNFLKRLDDKEVKERENLIANIRKLQVMTEIKGEYQYDEDGNVSVMYKESNGNEGLMALPKNVYITLPVLNESSYVATMELELELIKPKSEGEKPGIILTCPKFDKHKKDAVKSEIDILKNELPEHLVLAGRD